MTILDTNVVSEAMRQAPSERVLQWLDEQPPSEIFTTAITQAEILYGIELLAAGGRKMALESAAAAMFAEDFAQRILPFDEDAAHMFSRSAAARRKLGRPISFQDAQIAAIALSRGAVLATRNTADFDDCGLTVVLNPWDMSG